MLIDLYQSGKVLDVKM